MRKLGRTTAQRKAMLRGMTTLLLECGKVETTYTRAQELSAKAAQKLVTSPSIGKAMHNWFRPQHALKTHRTKKGNIAYNGRIFSLPKKSAY